MKDILAIGFFLLLTQHIQAQTPSQYDYANIGGQVFTLKKEIPLVKPATLGSTYLDETWQEAEIVLKNGLKVDQYPVRVEIEEGHVEILYEGETKYLDIGKVDYIRLSGDDNKRKWVIRNADEYSLDSTPLRGVVLVREGKTYTAVKHVYIETLPANYNIAMDVGSKADRRVMRDRLYLSTGGKLIPVKGSVKKIAQQMGQDKEKAIAIVREHRLQLSRESDLLAFVALI